MGIFVSKLGKFITLTNAFCITPLLLWVLGIAVIEEKNSKTHKNRNSFMTWQNEVFFVSVHTIHWVTAGLHEVSALSYQSYMHWVTNVLHHANHISMQNHYAIKVDIRHCGTLFTTMISYTLVSSHSGLLRELLCLLHIITIVVLTYAITNRQKYYISYNDVDIIVIWDLSVYVPSQWETTLQCNVVSHWLGTYTKLSLCYISDCFALNTWNAMKFLKHQSVILNVVLRCK